MDLEFISAAFGVIGGAATAGVGIGMARTSIRRNAADIEGLDVRITEHAASDVSQHTQIVQRLTRIETLLERINKRV